MVEPAAAVVVTWIEPDDVGPGYLGLAPDDVADAGYLADCTAAANAWCYRRRAEAGYVDDPTVVPSPDVRLGAILAAGGWYRRRGAPDGFAGWVEVGGVVPSYTGAGLADIYRLLGINRPVAI
jgi:hypothetical protein